MTRQQLDAIVVDLSAEVLTQVQNKITALADAGAITPAEGVYIGSTVMMRVGAVIIAGQMPPANFDKIEQFITSTNNVFAAEARAIIEHRQETEGKSTTAKERGKSAWDA